MKLVLFFIITFFLFTVISAQDKDEQELSESVSAALSLRFTEGRTDYAKSKIGLGFIGSVDYFVPSPYRSKLGVRLSAGRQIIYGENSIFVGTAIPSSLTTDMYLAGVGFSYAYRIVNSTYPFIYLGLSEVWFNPKLENGKKAPNNEKGLYKTNALSYDLGGGILYSLSNFISIRGEMLMHFLDTDYLDDRKRSTNDAYISLSVGISFALNRNIDSDEDGITNKLDACPDEAEDLDGYEDEDGCPDYDNDKDGIADQKDECPGIPEDIDGYQDQDGCPDFDNDNDGIPDLQDECQYEAEDFDGFNDQDGCPDRDNDYDGIPDSVDKCINAAEDKDNFQDEDGCPDPDNDNDGIFDINDKCPDAPETINGYKDTDGCPDTISRRTEKKPEEPNPEEETITLNTSQKEFVLPAGSIFSSESGTDLKSNDIPVLNRFVKMIQNDIESRWRIEVYTESGPADQMMTISKRRADAVLQYFVSKGLPSFQFQTFGMGSKNPVANNNTAEGRSKNRRIVIRKFR